MLARELERAPGPEPEKELVESAAMSVPFALESRAEESLRAALVEFSAAVAARSSEFAVIRR